MKKAVGWCLALCLWSCLSSVATAQTPSIREWRAEKSFAETESVLNPNDEVIGGSLIYGNVEWQDVPMPSGQGGLYYGPASYMVISLQYKINNVWVEQDYITTNVIDMAATPTHSWYSFTANAIEGEEVQARLVSTLHYMTVRGNPGTWAQVTGTPLPFTVIEDVSVK